MSYTVYSVIYMFIYSILCHIYVHIQYTLSYICSYTVYSVIYMFIYSILCHIYVHIQYTLSYICSYTVYSLIYMFIYSIFSHIYVHIQYTLLYICSHAGRLLLWKCPSACRCRARRLVQRSSNLTAAACLHVADGVCYQRFPFWFRWSLYVYLTLLPWLQYVSQCYHGYTLIPCNFDLSSTSAAIL